VLTRTTIARKINRPDTTVAYWSKRFEKYIPSTRKGRYKSYFPEALDVFQKINDILLSDKHQTYEAVEKILKKEFGEAKIQDAVVVEEETKTTKPTIEKQNQLTVFLNVQAAQQERLLTIIEQMTRLFETQLKTTALLVPPPKSISPPKKKRNRLIRLLTRKVF